MPIEYIGDDIVVVRRDNGSTWELYWGDPVHRFAERDVPPTNPAKKETGKLRIATVDREGNQVLGFIRGDVKLVSSSVLRFSMIDVQQGDGMIIETPAGKVIFIDGGDNKLFARHASARYPATTNAKPLVVDAMIITHGDADHFAGLTDLKRSESDTRPGKAIFVVPERIYHNGLVKRPGEHPDKTKRKDVDMFGAHNKGPNELEYATELVDDPRTVSEAERNEPFNTWCKTIDHWDQRAQRVLGKPIEIRRIDQHSDGFLPFIITEGLSVELLGPIVEQVGGAPALPFLRDPPDDANLLLGDREPTKKGSYSASHTVNGHSINIRLVYKNVRFLMTGDMNQEAMARLRRELPNADLTSEILKAPHHGSADFDLAFLKTVKPVVSLISSGDESLAKEHIHPRATMLSALGKVSRDPFGIIFNTELAAFFKYRGPSVDQEPGDKEEASYEGFERTNFGIIHVRTNGERVLTFTHSGKKGMNEAYRFTVAADESVTFAKQVTKIGAPAA